MTLSGLSGMGDLVLTCTGGLSRNRHVGVQLGKGKTLTQILAEMDQVAEGVKTAKSAYNLAQRENVDMPIAREVYRIIYEEKPPAQALKDLMARELRQERDG
jgi:glycerol-3-phosphate dehydrogenase (NAD(P)+)